MDIPLKIRRLMDARNLTTYALAEKAGLKQSTVSGIVSQHAIPKIDTLDAICKGLGITLKEFFTDEEDPQSVADEILRLYSNLSGKRKEIVLDLLKELQ